MLVYGITTPAREDRPAMTCYYPFWEWNEIIKDFNERGILYHAFTAHTDELDDDYE